MWSDLIIFEIIEDAIDDKNVTGCVVVKRCMKRRMNEPLFYLYP